MKVSSSEILVVPGGYSSFIGHARLGIYSKGFSYTVKSLPPKISHTIRLSRSSQLCFLLNCLLLLCMMAIPIEIKKSATADELIEFGKTQA